VSHLKTDKDGSITLVVDGRLYSRSLVKRVAATTTNRCHVVLDLDSRRNVTVRLSSAIGEETPLREIAGDFGNLLVAELAMQKLDAQTIAARNILLARALDGALPYEQRAEGLPSEGGQHEE
jgi:hypothetical protein